MTDARAVTLTPGLPAAGVVGLAVASAVCFVAAFPPVNAWPLVVVAATLALLAALTARHTFTWLLAGGVAYAGVWTWFQWWTIDVSVAGLPAFAGVLAVLSVIGFWALRRVGRAERFRRVPLAVVAGVVWTGSDALRGLLAFHGYPWYYLGQPLIEWPLAVQSADLVGALGATTLVAVTGGALTDAALWWWRGATDADGVSRRTRAVVGASLAAMLWAATLGYGAWRLGQTAPLRAGPRLLAVQTNLPTDNKIGWRYEQQIEDFSRFGRQTLEAFDAARTAGRTPDLVVWPETMVPGLGLEPDAIELLVRGGYRPGDRFSSGLATLTDLLDRPLLVGSPAFTGLRVEGEEFAFDERFNSAYLLQPRPDEEERPPAQRYDKIRLTPFGETMPYISAWPWLEEQLLAIGANGMQFDLESGTPRVLRVPLGQATLRIATPICFEDTVGSLCRSLAWADGDGKADLFVNLSNDGWFGRTDAGRLQHAQIARFRCIENRMPMVRVVNTGATVAIDSCGRVTAPTGPPPLRAPTSLLVETTLDERSTLYGRLGELWGWSMLALTGVAVAATIRRPASTP